MNKSYVIKLNNKIIGKTKLEKADAPIGVVSGEIIDVNKTVDYEFIKSFCRINNIGLADDYPKDKLISTGTIEQLKVILETGIEVKGLGNQISGMDSEGFQISVEGIGYPFFEEVFPHHVKGYEERFREK